MAKKRGRLKGTFPQTRKVKFDLPPAMEVASKILSGYRASKDEPSLADLFIAETHRPHYSGRTRKLHDEALMQYRLDMRKTHRFVLDDEFVEHATIVSNVPAEKLLARIQYATLPYEQTWIEFNLRTKIRTLRTIHKVNNDDYSEIPPRMGCLLQRINDTDAVCTLISEVDGVANPHMTCYFFSVRERDFLLDNKWFFGCGPMALHAREAKDRAEERIASEIEGDELRRIATSDTTGKASLWGYTNPSAAGIGVFGPRAEDMATPKFLLRHGDVGMSRMYRSFRQHHMSHKTIHKLTDLVLAELREFTGHMRWLVTVLAMLNEVPVHSNLVQRSHEKLRVDLFRKHTFVDYHKVSLKLPKTKPIPYIERYLAHSGRKHMAHEVRAFWRTYLHEIHCGADQHAWEYDYDNGYRLCGKCMAYGRHIHEHVRGDPSLGWVRKHYIIGKQR